MNLVRYHVEKNEEAFVSEVAEIAREFDQSGDSAMATYLMELVSSANYYVPQSSYKNLHYLTKVDYTNTPLLLPEIIEEDILGITRDLSAKGSGSFCRAVIKRSRKRKAKGRKHLIIREK